VALGLLELQEVVDGTREAQDVLAPVAVAVAEASS
jgi:hypothetical protein